MLSSSCFRMRQRLTVTITPSNSNRMRALFHASTTAPSDAAAAERTTAAASAETDPEGPPPIIWTTDRLNKDQIAKVDAVFHKILWLDMFETSMLNNLINERLGLNLTNKQRAQLQRQMKMRAAGQSGAATASVAVEAVEEGPKLVDLKLTGFDAKSKIKVIKEVRSIAGLGLKEAKELVEGFPKTIQKELKPEQAQELKAKLEAVGAIIELV